MTVKELVYQLTEAMSTYGEDIGVEMLVKCDTDLTGGTGFGDILSHLDMDEDGCVLVGGSVFLDAKKNL